MQVYDEAYLSEVVENQGKLFDMIACEYPEGDTEGFIEAYMKSKTRRAIDEGQAYVATMGARELWEYFAQTEGYAIRPGKALEGFMPGWIGEFYACYQWHCRMPSSEAIEKVPLGFLKKAYFGLHDLELDLAVRKVNLDGGL